MRFSTIRKSSLTAGNQVINNHLPKFLTLRKVLILLMQGEKGNLLPLKSCIFMKETLLKLCYFQLVKSGLEFRLTQ